MFNIINDESGNIRAYLQQAAEIECNAANYREEAARQSIRPFILLRPKAYKDGNKWCVLYGDDIQSGIAGFGDTPELAAIQFDKEWVGI